MLLRRSCWGLVAAVTGAWLALAGGLFLGELACAAGEPGSQPTLEAAEEPHAAATVEATRPRTSAKDAVGRMVRVPLAEPPAGRQ